MKIFVKGYYNISYAEKNKSMSIEEHGVQIKFGKMQP
jgi:hypothetical protein